MKPGFVESLSKRLKSTTITASGRPIKKAIIAVLALWVASVLVGWITAPLFRDSVITGPDGSAFVTDINGTAALARLLEDMETETVMVQGPLDEMRLGGTLLIIAPGFHPGYSESEISAIADHLSNGGRLIYAGFPHPDLEDALGYLDIGYNAHPEAKITFPVGNVKSPLMNSGIRSLSGAGLPLAGENPVAVAHPYGKGLVITIIDPEILFNSRIRENAAWAVAIIGEGPVFFDEYRHGFVETPPVEPGTGLIGSIPRATRHTLYLLGVVLFVWMIIAGRRFGPPEKQSRDMTPSRGELVNAVGGLLLRIHDSTDAAYPIPDRIARLISSRTGLGHDAKREEVVIASASLGLDPEEVTRALAPESDADLMIAGRVLAKLNERKTK